MDRLVEGILLRIKTGNLVDEENAEIYQFGLECMLLKAVHIMSYLVIGLCMGELLSLVVSGSILIPLRRKAGGFHAKTRIGCYIFSCGIITLLCLFNKILIMPVMGIAGVIVADILVLLFAPVENENRELDAEERILFRKQAICCMAVVNVILVVMFLFGKYLFVAYWLENGLIFAGILLLLGVMKKT